MSAVEASPNLRDFLGIREEQSGSASRRRDLADLFFNTVIATEKRPTPLPSPTVSPQASRTLLDIIRAEEAHAGPPKITVAQSSKDKKSWKSLKDKLRLKRPGGAWASNAEAVSSDSPAHKTCRSPATRHDVARSHSAIPVTSDELTRSQKSTDTHRQDEASSSNQVCDLSTTSRPSPARKSSTRFGSLVPISIEPARSIDSLEQTLRARISRQSSTRQSSARHSESSRSLARTMSALDPREMQHNSGQLCPFHQAEEPPRTSTRRLSAVLAEERQLSAREAAAAREATAVAPAQEEEQPVRMSLMDLLEETDRQMGLGGTIYETMGNGEEEDEVGGGGSRASVEQSCCICMVRHKGAAFIPCGHTFCRLCSRELWVSRGNCPLCNNYIVEILDIF